MILAAHPRQELGIPLTTDGYKLAVVKATDAHTILEISPSQELQPGVSETQYIVLSHQQLDALTGALMERYDQTQNELYDEHVKDKKLAEDNDERDFDRWSQNW